MKKRTVVLIICAIITVLNWTSNLAIQFNPPGWAYYLSEQLIFIMHLALNYLMFASNILAIAAIVFSIVIIRIKDINRKQKIFSILIIIFNALYLPVGLIMYMALMGV